MGFMSYFVNAINSIVNHFGWSVIISVCLCYAILIPFKILSHKNNNTKKKCAPELAAIRQKYGATQLGVAFDDNPNLSPEIRAMSHDERDEAMANEISAVYKKHGYHMLTGWIPGVLTILFIILLYSGIRTACPDGFYSLTFETFKTDFFGAYKNNSLILITMLCASLCTALFQTIKDCVKNKRAGLSIKSTIIAGCISAVLSLGLSIWVASAVTTAIAIAITTVYVLSFVESIVTSCAQKDDVPVQQLS